MNEESYSSDAVRQRKLEDFIGESESERDGVEDIYQRYRHETGTKLNVDELAPEAPRFQDYFNKKASDVSPFEHIAREKVELDDDHAAQIEEERELHKKELMGRLVSDRLTPR